MLLLYKIKAHNINGVWSHMMQLSLVKSSTVQRDRSSARIQRVKVTLCTQLYPTWSTYVVFIAPQEKNATELIQKCLHKISQIFNSFYFFFKNLKEDAQDFSACTGSAGSKNPLKNKKVDEAHHVKKINPRKLGNS